MQLFETLRMDEGILSRLPYHKSRMEQSAKQLGFNFDDNLWQNEVHTIIENYSVGCFRAKLILNQDGTMQHVVAELSDKKVFTAKFQPLPKHIPSTLLINKTTERNHLEHTHQTDLILLYDEKGKILEFDIGNVAIKENNQLFTPIYEADFLLGCKRQEMIDQGELLEKNFYVAELKEKIAQGKASLFLINSLREVADVEIYL